MRLTCLVDNCASRGTSLWGEHGLSFLIETAAGNVVWDTGQSGSVLRHNIHELGLHGTALAAAALSHAHYDHTGGLAALLEMYPGLTVYAHGDVFRERYSQRKGVARAIGIASQKKQLETQTTFHLSDSPQEILPEVWTTGGIRHRAYPQGKSPHHVVLEGGKFVADGYVDDMSLVLRTERGIVLLCGCCHAGLRNTIAAVRAQYHEPLLGIVGGTHLAGADEVELRVLVEVLRTEGVPLLYLNHCTGERALQALDRAFGQRVAPCPAGTILEF